jgi:GTP-binding protein
LKQAAATFAGSFASPSEFPRDGLPEVAFLGRSNVGKSSLLNALAGTRGLARVSSAPGRTRLVTFFRVAGVPRTGGRGKGDLYLVDLPGYGYAKAPREVRESFEGIAVSYLERRPALRLCVFIVDARHEPAPGDLTLRAWLEHHGLPYVVVANKLDALGSSEARRQLQLIERTLGGGSAGVLGVSATRSTGVETLWNLVRAAAFEDRPAAHDTADANGRTGQDGRTVGDHGR